MNSGITRDEWLNALHDAGLQSAANDPSALTVDEFATLVGLPHGTAANHLRRLVALGRAKVTAKWATSPAGRRIQYRAYKLTTPEKKTR